ncbi:hypothetical protein JXA80_13030 [bacterium]|nr:hypothetical protein [candidate division CSSED10-310 bacterium]
MKRRIPWRCILLIGLAAGALSVPLAMQAAMRTAPLQTRSPWLVAETQNFVIIAEENLRNQLPELAADCEQAYANLGPLFNWRFIDKVTVLFSDGADQHAGWATPMSHPTLFVMAAPPRNGSCLAGPFSHRKRTITHELTHLLQTDAQYGIVRRMHAVFGRVFADLMDPLSLVIGLLTLPPANAAPTWYLEGTAIWAESQYAGPGRGGSAEVDAYFRVAAAQNRLLPPERWHLRAPDWPYGSTAYYYGMRVIQEAVSPVDPVPLVDSASPVDPASWADPALPGRLGMVVAQAPLAGFFNSRARQLGSRDFNTIARDAWLYEQRYQRARIDVLQRVPLTAMLRRTPLDVQVGAPVWTPAGDVWVTAQSDERRSRLARFDLATNTLDIRGPLVTPGWTRTAVDPETGMIFFTRLDGSNGTEWRSRLYWFDPVTERSGCIDGLDRVMDIAAAPGGRLAVVRRSAAEDTLELWQWHGPERQSLVSIGTPWPPGFLGDNPDRVLSSPVFMGDADSLAFIRRDETGSAIYYYRNGQHGLGQLRQAADEDIRDLAFLNTKDSAWSGDGPSRFWHGPAPVLFCGDANGVFNVYRTGANDETQVLTHSLGGVYACAISSDGTTAALIGMDADGYYLTIIPIEELHPLTESLPVLDSPWRLPAPSPSVPPPRTWLMADPEIYHPLRHLRFDYWSPWLNAAPGYTAGGVVTRWTDRSLTHAVFAHAGVESKHQELIGSVHWDYLRSRPSWGIHISRQAPIYSGLIRDVRGLWFDLEEVRWTVTGAARWEWYRAADVVSVQAGWQGNHRAVKDHALWKNAMDDGRILNEPMLDGIESSLWVDVSINTATVYPRSLSLEDGVWIHGAADWSSGVIGSDVDRHRIRGDAAMWWGIPGWDNHVLKLSASYGAGWGDRVAQGAFTVGGYDDLGAGHPPGLDSAMLLRGYSGNIQTGTRAARLSASYRFPVWERYRSISARSALYVTQVMAELFWETAAAWEDRGFGRDWYRAAGTEFNLGAIWFSGIDLAPGIGVSWMPDGFEKNVESPEETDGDWSLYFCVKGTVNY